MSWVDKLFEVGLLLLGFVLGYIQRMAQEKEE